ncbi:hypothetical protein [Burkholderia cepacia]|uniref:hypothetical protein n=1 Tax=Burkholderia cepacia TaxID=292 RepID=UPI0029904231|nr:hypothetical protein [Burkholderia cepacia]
MFEDLRELASQLGALMVLAATGDGAADIDHPMFAVSIQRWSESSDAAQALRPSPLTAHHHRHLTRAAQLFGASIDAMRLAGTLVGRTESAFRTLKRAWEEMEYTSNALPGFHTVDLQQACCACHAPQRVLLAGH